MNEFVTHVTNEKINFSVMRLFEMDNTLSLKLLSAIITYSVYLMQFKILADNKV